MSVDLMLADIFAEFYLAGFCDILHSNTNVHLSDAVTLMPFNVELIKHVGDTASEHLFIFTLSLRLWFISSGRFLPPQARSLFQAVGSSR